MATRSLDTFGTRSTLSVAGKTHEIYRLSALEKSFPIARLPITLKIFLENMLRNEDGRFVKADDIKALAGGAAPGSREVFFMPARVLMQDFTGVPAVVDLAAMRDAMHALGGDPKKINPLVPVDLVIDHSVQVDKFGTLDSFQVNSDLEFERNQQRYVFLKWGQQAFQNFSVVPPETGIVHQVNLEYLASVVATRVDGDSTVVFPDTLVGTDSHTTMINGLGVMGWGVGGIEAEAVMLGQPMSMLIPEVVGFRLTGKLPAGATATDAVLMVTEMLRKKGVVGKFVEFFGPGLSQLSLADRATIANMCPEYGATVGYFPIDVQTIEYLKLTGRDAARLALVEAYCKAQGMFRADGTPEPTFGDVVELDLGSVEPSIAGPKRPQDRVPLAKAKEAWRAALPGFLDKKDKKGQLPAPAGAKVKVALDGQTFELGHDSVVIAAITSCTNTSNPSVLIAAGLLAKKAVERGLSVQPWVKTSLAPGSKVVTEYLKDAGLTPFLDKLKFNLVGYGCTTCIAAGTPVLMSDGTARRIESLPLEGGAGVFGPTKEGSLAMVRQERLIDQGARDCVSLTLQDGRELVCTPDHELLTVDGRWVRADTLVAGRDRLVIGLEAPVDEPLPDETGYVLKAGDMIFTMETPERRARTLAFARLVGHLLGDGSISVLGQGRMNVGQAVDRNVLLNDVELLTGKRPAGTRYDDFKWSIALPLELTKAIVSLSGVVVGRRINQTPSLPDFVSDEACPIAVVREFLGGKFGADGTAPCLKRMGDADADAVLSHPAFSQSAKPHDVPALKEVMLRLVGLLERCGVDIDGAGVYEYPVRRAASSYPAPQDGEDRVEVRLSLTHGLSFVEHVGFRYCVDKSLRATAAAAYWRTIDRIARQRLWMSAQLEELKKASPSLTFREARKLAAMALQDRETVIFPHYSLLQGYDRFSRLPKSEDRSFRPLHRDSCGFPSPVEFLGKLGIREWFAPLSSRAESHGAKRYCVDKNSETLPTFTLELADRRPAGKRDVYDLTISDVHAFVAGTVAVHNCIGNSGPLPEPIAEAITSNRLVTAAVLSGNRNFEGRINPHVKANYLASPPLVVAYALAGRMDIDMNNEPLGQGKDGRPVFLRDLWPSESEIQESLRKHVTREMFVRQYKSVYDGDENWRGLKAPAGERFAWDSKNTYIKNPPYFAGLKREPSALADIQGARVLAVLGDSVTTDHISPAGNIPKDSPAGQYLLEHEVTQKDFNSYGARRGNHELMMRGTFANIRLRNALAGGTEGGVTVHLPEKTATTIFEASDRYIKENAPLLILAGKEYGSGSSRDWAAKGPNLLGVKAVIAESYERIHRSNLVGMGILPLQFPDGESAASLGLTGTETFAIEGIAKDLKPRKEVTVTAKTESGETKRFKALVRIDTPVEIEYYRYGGILPYVLIQLLGQREGAAVTA